MKTRLDGKYREQTHSLNLLFDLRIKTLEIPLKVGGGRKTENYRFLGSLGLRNLPLEHRRSWLETTVQKGPASGTGQTAQPVFGKVDGLMENLPN